MYMEFRKTDITLTKRIPLNATGIFSRVELKNPDMPEVSPVTAKAMWDTGATISIISERIFEELKLKPEGYVFLDGAFAARHSFKAFVIVSVCSDGHEIMTTVAVTDSINQKDSADIVLGLDFISKGDFAISHDDDGYPIFSFSYPPRIEIDFSKMAKQLNMKTTSEEH